MVELLEEEADAVELDWYELSVAVLEMISVIDKLKEDAVELAESVVAVAVEEDPKLLVLELEDWMILKGRHKPLAFR